MICEGCRYLPWLTKRFKRVGSRKSPSLPVGVDPAKAASHSSRSAGTGPPAQPAACVNSCCHCYSHTGFTWSQAGGRVVELVIKDRSHLGSLLFDEGSRQPHRLDCDILINCTGLHGARDIFGDESVYPIRGQVWANVDGEFY
jgi:hypothetical protein